MACQNLSQRRSIRLYEYDYSQGGLYFVTICTKDKVCLFGNIVDGEMILNDAGKIARECWLAIPEHYRKWRNTSGKTLNTGKQTIITIRINDKPI
ncbi:hypothetical protein [Dysgonomonas termitidis]|uniref:Uncharacterized protein n=1 Tax=Dysgonomonas termitidis TaxID=1516126 RepID=A0ABV9L2V8_9BACT